MGKPKKREGDGSMGMSRCSGPPTAAEHEVSVINVSLAAAETDLENVHAVRVQDCEIGNVTE